MPYCKFYKEKEQVSYDSGQTWSDIPGTDRKGNIYEYDSPDCGSPQTFFPKWIAHYVDGYIISAECDSTSAITQNEIPSYAYYYSDLGSNSIDILEIGDCVTTIDDSACANFQIMSIVTIPNSVTTIGSEAFSRCDHIGNIVIPDSVITIGYAAFYDCSGATSLTIGSGVTTIGNTSFQYCNQIRNIVIPDSVITIGYAAFKDCSGLTSCTIGSGVTSISGNAFQNCGSLTSIDIPDSVITLEGAVFGNCSGLTSCTIGSRVTEIGLDTFSNCYKLTGITIPDTVTSIGSWAFTNCISLSSCTIGIGVTSISTNAFSNCANLTSITIKATVPPTLDTNVFYGTPISTIYVPCESIDAYKSASGWSNYASIIQCPLERWVNNPDGYECSGTTKMNQEKKQISYDSGSTWTDTNPLETRIGSTVLQYNSPDCGYVMYRWVDNPDGYECSGTTKMSQEKKQTSIDGGSTWSDVSPLETRIGSTVIQYDSTDCGGHISSVKYKLTLNDSSTVSAECNTSTIATRTITKEEVSSQYSGSVASAEIGECVESIGFDAFYGCSGLTSVVIPDSVTNIGGYAFSACTSLTSIIIPSGVTSIGERAFSVCSGLTSIVIPDGVTSIEYSTFGQCNALTSVTIGSGVTTIGGSAFYNCRSLTSINIPSGVTSIGNYAFWNCTGLTSVTVNAATPPTLGTRVFYGTNDCPIYVPSASVETYKAASGWSTYASRIQAIP